MTELKLEIKEQIELPIIPLRGVVVFPSCVIAFDVGRQKSIQAMEEAMSKDNNVFLTAQKNPTTEEPPNDELFTFGAVAKIKQIFRLPGGVVRIIAVGIDRGIINCFTQSDPYIKAEINVVAAIEETPESIDESIIATVRVVHEAFEQYVALNQKTTPDVIMEILNCETPAKLADLVAANTQFSINEKQLILEETESLKRLAMVAHLLHREIGILSIQKEVLQKVKFNIDKHQREYYLREQLKVIQEELGEKDGILADVEKYKERLEKLTLPDYAVEKFEFELNRLKRASSTSPESAVIRDYLDCILSLPWSERSEESKGLKKARQVLDKDHYGLEKVKERIIEFLAVRQVAKKLDSPILCLVGPPGVGKTSIAKSVAKALNRKYIRLSLGGVKDEAEIRGHRKTYVGAMPGRIIYSMRQAQTLNPLILLDEIDKLSSDFRGDPSSAMLEVLDPEQNNAFRDNYLEIHYDLSDVLFICTANSIDTIPYALKDRLEIISLTSYTEDEKENIAIRFLINKQLNKHGLKKYQLKISKECVCSIIKYYTKEAGVRQLERCIGEICRKSVKEILTEGKKKTVNVTHQNLELFLGKRKYHIGKINEICEIGVAKGLAWTAVGGDTLSIEVNVMHGSGELLLTGNLGDVMKESAQAAISYIRANFERFRLERNFYKNIDIHIHVPEGATPKDGPSAGITIATAMISALSQTPVRNDVCMTGEITIRGRVLPIGGLKEKVVAAKSQGILNVIIPLENEPDLMELPKNIREGVSFVLADNMETVLANALVI